MGCDNIYFWMGSLFGSKKNGFIYHPNARRKTTGDKMNERCIPGIIPVEWREYRYIADNGSGHFVRKGLFEKLVSQITPRFQRLAE